MKKRILSVLLVVAMVAALFVGCGKNDNKKREPYVPTVTNLDEIKIGAFDWPVHQGYDYSQPYNKRFDGLEFTFCANGTGTELEKPYSPEENPETWRLQGVTGLKARVKWMATGEGYNAKLGQAITMGDIPDVMGVTMIQYQQMVKAGLLADLTDELLEGNHPLLQDIFAAKDNAALEALMVDGRIYGIPGSGADYDGHPFVWIRKDWLEKLGIEGPKSWKDLERVAKAFQEQDPDGNGRQDTIGIPIVSNYGGRGNGTLSELFLNLGGANINKWMKKEDGTLMYGSVHPGAKEALTLLRDWYKKGIIEEDFALWDDGTITQMAAENQCGIVLSPWHAGTFVLADCVTLNPEAEWESYLLPGEEGEPVYATEGNGIMGITVVSKDFPHPEAFVYAMDMLEANGSKYNPDAPDTEFAYGQCEGYIEVSGGYKPIGGPVPYDYYTAPIQDVYDNVEKLEDLTTYASVEEINKYLEEKVKAANGSWSRTKATTGVNLPIILADLKGEDPRKVKLVDNYGETLDATASYIRYLTYWEGPEAVVRANPVGVNEAFLGLLPSGPKYTNFLGTYTQETFTNIIMGKTGGKSISEAFDEYVKQFNKKGGSILTEEANKIYKELQKNKK